MKSGKILRSIAAVFAITILLLCFRVPAYAISQNEADASEALTLNAASTGCLTDTETEKWYRFDISAPGRFRIRLNANASADTQAVKEGWHIYLYKKGDLGESFADLGGIKTDTFTGWFGYVPDTFYVRVTSSSTRTNYMPVDCPFDITVVYEATNEWEKEINDTNALANPITPNAVYRGNHKDGADKDWYYFSIAEKGYFSVSFGPDPADCDTSLIKNGWNITVYEPDAMTELVSKTVTGAYTSTAFPMAPGNYFIKIESASTSAAYSPLLQVYDLKVNAVAGIDWEMEHNDTQTSANELNSGALTNGNLHVGGDQDWYSITTSGTGILQLSFEKGADANTDDIKNGWKISVVEAKSSEVIYESEKVLVSQSAQVDVDKGTYYIHIESFDAAKAYQPTGCRYMLRANFKAGENTRTKIKGSTVKWKKAKASGRTSVLKWKKIALADGYEIYRSVKKKKGYSKCAETKGAASITYKDNRLKDGKYYYKVRAYKTIQGKKVYSKYSAIKLVTIKG
ncbi:MAG: hypothetical protein J5842_03025 [Lachnospiraceae bacterium]|nr:hypothetical protein [Lachnospiraceae bacterium]